MPELLEAEAYRRAARRLVGRQIDSIRIADGYSRGGETSASLTAICGGLCVVDARRAGKAVLLDLTGPPTIVLGLRFGMTGRLIVDDVDDVGELLYSSGRDDPAWDRFELSMADGGRVRLNDPRRFGSVELNPPVEHLGSDATTLTAAQLRRVLIGTAPLKSALLDQRRIAGIGNLLADDALWRARLAPTRVTCSLDANESAVLARAIRRTIQVLGRRGGSHLGDLQRHRSAPGECPRCGQPLLRTRVGGRTTIWCPAEQQ